MGKNKRNRDRLGAELLRAILMPDPAGEKLRLEAQRDGVAAERERAATLAHRTKVLAQDIVDQLEETKGTNQVSMNIYLAQLLLDAYVAELGPVLEELNRDIDKLITDPITEPATEA